MNDFDGLVAMVTGGAAGIGAATAALLLDRGAQVAVLDRDATLQRVTQAQERTGRIGPQERARSLNTRVCLADTAVCESHPRQRQLADERKGGTAVLTHREGLLGRAFGLAWPPLRIRFF